MGRQTANEYARDLDKMRAYVCDRAFSCWFEAFARGEAPIDLLEPRCLGVQIKELQRQISAVLEGVALTPEQTAWLKGFNHFSRKIQSFDRDRYSFLRGEFREIFVLRFALESAEILQGMQSGYRAPDAAGQAWVDPLAYFVALARETPSDDL